MTFCINTQELRDRLMTASNLFAFKTTAKVVMEASNLRLEAIKAIGREYGVDIKDPEGRCIDENLLDKLADAHVRQLKSYFNHTKRHLHELSGAELQTFADFYKTFKKRQSTKDSLLAWNIIDTEAIKEQFIRKVHNLTLETQSQPTLISQIIDFNLQLKNQNEDDTVTQHQDFVIDNVLKMCWHYADTIKCTPTNIDKRSTLKRFTMSARYHAYVSEEDHLVA